MNEGIPPELQRKMFQMMLKDLFSHPLELHLIVRTIKIKGKTYVAILYPLELEEQ